MEPVTHNGTKRSVLQLGSSYAANESACVGLPSSDCASLACIALFAIASAHHLARCQSDQSQGTGPPLDQLASGQQTQALRAKGPATYPIAARCSPWAWLLQHSNAAAMACVAPVLVMNTDAQALQKSARASAALAKPSVVQAGVRLLHIHAWLQCPNLTRRRRLEPAPASRSVSIVQLVEAKPLQAM